MPSRRAGPSRISGAAGVGAVEEEQGRVVVLEAGEVFGEVVGHVDAHVALREVLGVSSWFHGEGGERGRTSPRKPHCIVSSCGMA